MTGKRRRATPGQTVAAWIVLAVLVGIAGWLWHKQAILSPAVEAALRPPPPAGAVRPAGTAAFATPAFLEALPGGAPAGPVESFDPDTLSDKIDGKAELYLAAHFKEMSCRTFAGPDNARYQVGIYAMATPKDAFAVASAQRRHGATAVAFAPEATLTENTVSFTAGRHYVEISVNRIGVHNRETLLAMGKALAGRIPSEQASAGTARKETALFPAEGLEAQSVRLAATDAMGLAGFANVYTADYALPKGQATAFLAIRDTPGAATADAAAFAAFLGQNGYVPATAPPGTVLPAGAKLLAADGSFEIIFTRGALLTGVHDAQSLDAALDLAGRLEKRLAERLP